MIKKKSKNIKTLFNSLILMCTIAPFNAQVKKINYETPVGVGRFKDDRINESSGMAFSYKTADAFWTHNDSGDGPNLYLVNKSGDLLTRASISGATSSDWEDLASFELGGKSYLIVGDFGDNPRARSEYRLYIIEEPIYDPQQTSGNSYPIVRTIKYQYDNGKQNCESVGVDVTQGKIILFSKSHDNEVRYVYEMALSVTPGTVTTTANRIASLRSDDTTAMDISNDGHHAAVLTYKDFAYEFTREDGETWAQAFNKPYRKITMPIGRAGEEALAYDRNAVDLYTTREGKGGHVYFLKGIEEQDPNAPNQAVFVSQTSVPYILGKGESASVSVTIKNTGTTTWTKTGLYKLGSLDDNGDLGLVRVELDPSDEIKPNEEKTFTFTITGPNKPGAYNFQWRMVQDNVEWFGTTSSKKQIVVLASNNYLDDCDATTDWNSDGALSLTNTNKIQGTAAMEFSGSDVDEYKKIFSTPYDAKGTPLGTVLQFWYYVSDPTKLEGQNQVEISSSGGPDTNEYSWSLSNIKTGWNFIKLDVQSANKSGNPDLSAINWFRIYRFKSGPVTTRVDAIQLIGENALSVDGFDSRKSFNMYPNPADNELNTSFKLLKSSTVSMMLINIMGQIVSQPVQKQNMSPGNHKLEISVGTLESGIYFASIKIDGMVFTKKVFIE